MQNASRWAWLTARRVVDVGVVVVLVVIGTALLIHLAPGDPVRAILGTKAPQEAVDALREQLSLNDPLFVQLGGSLADAMKGDIGTSLISGRPVISMIGQALPVTGSIILTTLVFSLGAGVPLGLYAALRHGKRSDRLIGTGALIILAIPPFVLSLLLIGLLAVGLGWFPAGGWSSQWPEMLYYLVLPSLALTGYLGPQIMRSTRQSALSILDLQFLESAKARGLSRQSIVLRHLLPNSALPIITVVGVNAAALVSGTVIVEALFGLPGFGQLIQVAVATRDYTVLQGTALVTAIAVVVVNLLCEVLYRLVDPRVRITT